MDLELIEAGGNGGDLVKKPKDLSVIYGFQNMPYLAMFGGNVAADTQSQKLPTEQDFSWWGNSIISPDDSKLQFNSRTERALMQNPVTSAGRAEIEKAVRADLQFMKDFCEVAVAVKIVATDVIAIGVKLKEPTNLQERDFLVIWDATKMELSLPVKDETPQQSGGDNNFFDYFLDFEFL